MDWFLYDRDIRHERGQEGIHPNLNHSWDIGYGATDTQPYYNRQ